MARIGTLAARQVLAGAQTMTQQSYTPADISIEPRNREHAIADCLGRNWFGGSVFKTAWFNAMSITFPLGEKFFIDVCVTTSIALVTLSCNRKFAAFAARRASIAVSTSVITSCFAASAVTTLTTSKVGSRKASS